jgi:hypothetical protein
MIRVWPLSSNTPPCFTSSDSSSWQKCLASSLRFLFIVKFRHVPDMDGWLIKKGDVHTDRQLLHLFGGRAGRAGAGAECIVQYLVDDPFTIDAA